jgi:flagellin
MITVNTNMVSSWAAYNLNNTNTNLQRSLARLSSGSRINSSYDDAGGLAVSMKLSAAIRRTEASQSNINNTLAMLQTQDGALKSAEKVLTRMSELIQLSGDVTKSTNDRALYQTEYQSLQVQMVDLVDEQFNGVNLFTNGGWNAVIDNTSTSGNTLTVVLSQDGGQTTSITQSDLGSVAFYVGTASAGLAGSTALSTNNVFQNITTAAAAITTVNQAIQNLASLRATNGSEQVRLTFAADMLAINRNNLQSASSQILDVDVAAESANLAKQNILQQAGTSMLAQANMSSQSVLRLLT